MRISSAPCATACTSSKRGGLPGTYKLGAWFDTAKFPDQRFDTMGLSLADPAKYAPAEYGFFANVNPHVDHPRWSQATEQRIGESGRRPTLMFNGYEEQVGHLYAGMDLRANF